MGEFFIPVLILIFAAPLLSVFFICSKLFIHPGVIYFQNFLEVFFCISKSMHHQALSHWQKPDDNRLWNYAKGEVRLIKEYNQCLPLDLTLQKSFAINSTLY